MTQISLPNARLVDDCLRDYAAHVSLPAAQAYCRRLARTHYENFTVASWLLPRHLRQHFANVYAYCRGADDLADDPNDPEQRLQLLDAWEDELDRCYRGEARHPVFVALAETIRDFSIPREPFADLLVAFRQDQRVTRYESYHDLLDYCRYSANPVGRLVLYLGRAHDGARSGLADAVCTGLQLINFCQDVARDYAQGRIYLPQDELRTADYAEAQLARGEFTPALREVLERNVDRAEQWLNDGNRLVPLVPPALQVDVALFVEGGLRVCRAVRQIDYNVLAQRPTVSRFEQLSLLLTCAWRVRRLRGTRERASMETGA